MNTRKAREVLGAWAASKGDAIALAATEGVILDEDALAEEIAEAIIIAEDCGNQEEAKVLRGLYRWVQRNCVGPVRKDGDVFLTLPWYKETEV